MNRNTFQINKLFLEKANTYRIHLDNLRWTLNAGYGAFAFVILPILMNSDFNNSFPLAIITSFGVFLISLCYLFILAVQNWYYNLYAQYVNYCEERIYSDKAILPMKQFLDLRVKGDSVRNLIRPNHPSFSFVLIYMAISQSIYLIIPILRFSTFDIIWIFLICITIIAILVYIYRRMFDDWSIFYNRFIKPIIGTRGKELDWKNID